MRIFMRFPEGCAKALTFSYDDGVTQDRRLVELLNRNGLKGTFNLNSGLLGMNQNEYQQNLTSEEIAELYTPGGHEVAMHGLTHAYMEKLPEDCALYEVLEDRKNLEQQFHRPIRGMAYPWGTYNDTVADVLRKAGIGYARTIYSTGIFQLPEDWFHWDPTCHHADPRLMELAKQFVNETPENQPYDRTPWLFYVWGHSYEFDMYCNWNIIENFASFMAGHSDIWYATNGEIHDYVEAYHRLNWTLEGNIVYNSSAIPVWFEADHKSYVVHPDEMLTL